MDPHGTTASGLVDELDSEAERAVERYLSQPDLLELETDPLEVMVEFACDRLLPLVDDLTALVKQLEAEIREPYELRAKLEAELSDVDVGDALLIKKHADDRLPELGVFGDNQPRMTNQRLRGMHPVPFEGKTDDAMNMRLDRIKKTVEKRGLKSLKRKGPTILELLRDELEGSAR